MLPEMLRGQVWSWHLNPQGLEYELLALMGALWDVWVDSSYRNSVDRASLY